MDDDDDAVQEVMALQTYAKKLPTTQEAIAESYSDVEALHKHVNDIVKTSSQTRDALEIYALQKSHIVFATLVASGRYSLNQSVPHFDTVLVDESSQALIPEVFITFKFRPELML